MRAGRRYSRVTVVDTWQMRRGCYHVRCYVIGKRSHTASRHILSSRCLRRYANTLPQVNIAVYAEANPYEP